jgi:hypothetical protein
MKNKKAQSMPMNAIVIAAIVLVVMVVLILIFTGGIGTWRQDKEATQSEAMARAECLGKMGTVVPTNDCDTDNVIPIEGLGTGLVCCSRTQQTTTGTTTQNEERPEIQGEPEID